MTRPAKITTPFPTLFETAKKLGISREDPKTLSDLARRAVETGEFALPGVGRLVQVRRAPGKGSAKTSRKRVVTFRVLKESEDSVRHRNKSATHPRNQD